MSSIPCQALPNGLCIPCFWDNMGPQLYRFDHQVSRAWKEVFQNTKHICCKKEATVWWLFVGLEYGIMRRI